MSIKSSKNYLHNVNGVCLFQTVRTAVKTLNPVTGKYAADLKQTAEIKRLRNRGKSFFIFGTPDAICTMFDRFPELFRVDQFIEWDGQKNALMVKSAVEQLILEGYSLHIDFLPIDYKEIPSTENRGKSVFIENMAAERLTALTGKKWERIGDKRRGAHGSYYPDVECPETGLIVEVKGCGSVFSCKAARDVHQHGTEEE